MKRSGVALAMCLLLVLGAVGTAHASTTYPQQFGSQFLSSSDGWSDTEHSCSLILPNLVCTVQNSWNGAVGNPPGALQSKYTTVAGLLMINTATASFTSPEFTVTGPGPIVGGVVNIDRKADVQALLDLGTDIHSILKVVNTDTHAVTTLDDFHITSADTTFIRRTITADPSLFTVGGHYQLVVTSTFTSLLQAALGEGSIYYDNIGLNLDDGTQTQKPTVTTLPATHVTGTTATLNSRVNPNGTDTNVGYQYGLDTNYGNSAPQGGGFVAIGSGTSDVEPNAVEITGLTPCTVYHFTVTAGNPNGTSNGADETFKTDCPPSVTTLPASPGAATAATLNGSITSNSDTGGVYHFEYGTTTNYGTSTPTRAFPGGHPPEVPVPGEPIGGLTPQTVYHVRIVATNAQGTTNGNDVTFTTPPATGPTGPQGAQGAPGTNGTNGTNGAQGPQGLQGLTGATGPQGKQGPSGLNGSDLVVKNGKGLLKMKSSTVRIGLRGRRAGQIRLPIFCTRKTGRSCAGTLKVRTINKINPSTSGGHYKKRRVTFFTGDYQLKLGAVGVVIGELQPEKLDLARKVRSVAVQLSITVTDAVGNRQTIVQNGRLIARNTV